MNWGFVPIARAAIIITEEEDPQLAQENLWKFLQDNPECAQEVLCQYQGFWGIRGDFEHLREEYRAWAQRVKEEEERQAEEKILAEIRALKEKQKAVSEKRRAAGRAGGEKSARRRKNS
jgi:hypothetical protein